MSKEVGGMVGSRRVKGAGSAPAYMRSERTSSGWPPLALRSFWHWGAPSSHWAVCIAHDPVVMYNTGSLLQNPAGERFPRCKMADGAVRLLQVVCRQRG